MVSQVKSMQQLSADADSFSLMMWDVLVSVRLEIFMFVAAVAAYLVLFASRVPKDVQRLKSKGKLSQERFWHAH